MKPFLVKLFVVCSLLLIHSEAFGDKSVRCGTRLVFIGDETAVAVDACGQPDHAEQWEEGENAWIQQRFDYREERYIAPRLIKGPIRVEVWTYDLGPGRFNRRLYFRNGKLNRIESVEKGP